MESAAAVDFWTGGVIRQKTFSGTCRTGAINAIPGRPSRNPQPRHLPRPLPPPAGPGVTNTCSWPGSEASSTARVAVGSNPRRFGRAVFFWCVAAISSRFRG